MIMQIELAVDIIMLTFENHWIMGVFMSIFMRMQYWEVLYISEIVYQWIGIIKIQHPMLFRMLKYIYKLIEINQILVQLISCLDLS